MSHLAGKRPSNNSDVKHGSCFPHTLPGLISTFSTRMLEGSLSSSTISSAPYRMSGPPGRDQGERSILQNVVLK